jgi:hypothetical protein
MPAKLPGGLTPIMRFIFNLPSWVQITAVSIAALLGIAVLWLLWRRRAAIAGWISSRSRGWKIALVAAALVVVAGAGAGGVAGWNYSMHDNSFCVSCHLMTPAFQRFEVSQHRNLECHACHRQSIFASLKQLYYWVAERPSEVPKHSKVPTKVCSECHTSVPGALELHGGPNATKPVKLDRAPDDTMWKHVLQTAGHSVHMRNADPKLKEIACVTCHGAEIHRFQPVDKTCGQARCHDDIHIQLGKMAGQTSQHCTGCHAFKTGIVTANVSPDSARTSLVPKSDQCFSCHQMREKLAAYDPAADKHEGTCGACHDPHKQKKPSDAFATCQTGSCHQQLDTVTAFHRGLERDVLANCGSCHKAHTWKVQSTDCKACHVNPDARLPNRGAHSRFRTASAGGGATELTFAGALAAPPLSSPLEPPKKRGGPMADDDLLPVPDDTLPPDTLVPVETASHARKPADSTRFSHQKHKELACTSCHSADRSHGELLVRGRNDCAACHHATTQKAGCRECHDDRQLGKQMALAVPVKTTVTSKEITRTLPFQHAQHAKTECKACHSNGPTLEFDRGCASCHDDHHVAVRDCKTCHTSAPPKSAHARDRVHQGCDGSGCHQDASVAALPAARNVCLACHTKQVDHKPGRDCAPCHLVAWNDASRGGMQ